jgi:hypothetical protein
MIEKRFTLKLTDNETGKTKSITVDSLDDLLTQIELTPGDKSKHVPNKLSILIEMMAFHSRKTA